MADCQSTEKAKMVELPRIDLRFVDLGEPELLVDYATEMGDQLRIRWDQHSLRVATQHAREQMPPEEASSLMRGEEYRHSMFEQLLGAQILITAYPSMVPRTLIAQR
jgi:hypothetical protein